MRKLGGVETAPAEQSSEPAPEEPVDGQETPDLPQADPEAQENPGADSAPAPDVTPEEAPAPAETQAPEEPQDQGETQDPSQVPAEGDVPGEEGAEPPADGEVPGEDEALPPVDGEIPGEEDALAPEETEEDEDDGIALMSLPLSGECGAQGNNVLWTLDENRTLTISGSGAMADYDGVRPWTNNSELPQTVVVEEGITYVGATAFSDYCIESVSLPASLTGLGRGALSGPDIQSITVSPGSESYKSVDGVLFDIEQTALIRYPAGKTSESYQVPAGVTELREDALSNNYYLKTVILPQGLKTIEQEAFAYVHGLTKIDFPETVNTIGSMAFIGSGLSGEIVLPENVSYVGTGAFSGCSGITKITVKNSLCMLGTDYGTFCDPSVILAGYENSTAQTYAEEHSLMFDPLGLQEGDASGSIGGLTWRYSNGKLSITGEGTLYAATTSGGQLTASPWAPYAAQVTTVLIGPYVFLSNAGLTFRECVNLAAYEVPDSYRYEVKDGVLFTQEGYYDSGVELVAYPVAKPGASYSIPGNVRTISTYAFYNCKQLTSVTIPEGVMELEASAFENCTGLTQVDLPASVATLGSAFVGCTGLQKLTVLNHLCSLTDFQYTGDPTGLPENILIAPRAAALWGYAGSTLEKYAAEFGYHFESLGEVPEELKTISGQCGPLTWSVSEDCVLRISGNGAMPDKGQGAYPWSVYTIVKQVIVEEGVTYVGGYAFCELNNLVTVQLPASMTGIGNDVFTFGSQNLKTIEVASGNPAFESRDGVLFTKGLDTLVAFPRGRETYAVPAGVKHIGESAFCNAWLTNLSLPEGLLTIEGAAFGFTGIRQLSIPNTVTKIGNRAFDHCYNLTRILIPASVTEFGQYAVGFKYNESMGTVVDEKITICGEAGSAAERYANENGIHFETDTSMLAMPLYTVENVANGIRIKWQQVSGAEKYRIWMTELKEGVNSWKSLAVTDKLEYVWTGAKAGGTYIFAVEALKGNISSGYDENGIWIERVPQPGLPKIAANDQGLEISWSTVTGADSYRVLAKIDGQGDWQQVGDVKGQTGTKTASFIWSDYQDDTAYHISIQAYIDGYDMVFDYAPAESSWNNIGTPWVTVGTPGAPTVKNGAKGIELTWDGVGTAQKYQVYYQIAGSGKWLKAGTATGTSYTWSGAKAGTSYLFAVQGLNGKFSGKYSAASAQITRVAQPGVPKIAGGAGGLTLTWSKVAGAEHYNVLMKTSTQGWENADSKAAEPNALTYTWADTLTAGMTYQFSIQAVAADGSVSTWNEKGTEWTVVGKPGAPEVKNGTTGIELSWDEASEAQKYQVYYRITGTEKWLKAGTATGTSYIWKGAKANTSYELAVQGLKGKFSGAYSDASEAITRLTQPALPKVAGGEDGLLLTWTAVKGMTGIYHVYVKEGGGAWESKYTTDTNSFTVPQSNLKDDTEYLFSIQAEMDGSVSAWNDKGTAWTVVGVPNIQGVENGASGIELSWTTVNTAQKYQVYYRTQNISGGKWLKAGTATGTSYIWKGAKANTKYIFAVQGLKGKFSGAYSDASAAITRLTQPALPKVTGGEGGLNLTWTAVKGMTGIYHVYVKEGGGAWESKYTSDTNSFTVPQSNLKDDTEYLFSIQAEMDGSVSTWNDKGTAWTVVGVPNIQEVENGASGIELSWTTVNTAQKYQVYYRTQDPDGGKWLKAGTATGTSYIWKGAKANTKYIFAVQGLKGKFSGAYSDASASITRLTQPALPKVAGGEDGLTLTWTAVKGLQGSYTVLVKEGAEDWTPKYTSETNKFVIPKAALSENTDYLFSIQTKAADGSGVSTWNEKGTAWTVVGVPSIQEAKNGVKGIDLSWTGVTTAQKYQVYYRITGSEKWLKAGTSTGTTLTWKGAKANTTYEFAVQGLKGKFSGAYSAPGGTITRVTQPALPKITGGEGGLSLTWTAIKGMTGIYHVYVKEGDGAWTPKYTSDTNSFTVPQNDLTAGTPYLFSIQAEMNGDKGTWNEKGTAWTAVGVPGAPTAVIGAKGIDLTWTGVETALKYQVYYRVTGTEKWVKAGATADTAFTWKGAKANTTYEFVVQGLSGKFSSAYSERSAAIASGAPSAPSGGGSEQTQTFNLYLSHGLAEDHPVHIALTAWAAEVAEKSGGTINIRIFPNGTLGSEADNISQIQKGALEMAKVSASTLGNFKSEWNAASVPYVFNDKDHYYKVMDGEIAQELYGLTESDGFIGLTWLDTGARSFYTAKTPIRTPADLKGLKIRVMNSQMAIDMMTALGGSATVMGYSDILTGMQQGVVNGAENNITAMRDHAGVTQYYCVDEHAHIPDIVVISTKVWNSMSDSQRQIMTETAKAMTESYKTAWAQCENKIRAQAEADGVEFIEDVDTAAFRAACQSVYDNLKIEDPAVYAFVEKIRAVA